MDDSLDLSIADHGRDEGFVADVADDERQVPDRRSMARCQRVEHDHIVAAGPQEVCRVRADVASPAGDQDAHGFSWDVVDGGSS